MLELASPLTFLILLNSFFTITLVLNQNDSAKDSASVQNSSSISNPLEKFTWICLIIQLILLLLKTKITDF
jgi:hypothetical protein